MFPADSSLAHVDRYVYKLALASTCARLTHTRDCIVDTLHQAEQLTIVTDGEMIITT